MSTLEQIVIMWAVLIYSSLYIHFYFSLMDEFRRNKFLSSKLIIYHTSISIISLLWVIWLPFIAYPFYVKRTYKEISVILKKEKSESDRISFWKMADKDKTDIRDNKN
jgi:hypothetical protein